MDDLINGITGNDSGTDINFLLTQGFGLFNTNDGWSGNLTTLIEGKGYWVNITDGSLDFKWGMSDCNNYSRDEFTAAILTNYYEFL